MWKTIKAFFNREKTFLEKPEFKGRLDDILMERLGNAPMSWSLEVLDITLRDSENWMHNTRKAITEEQFMSIFMQHIENCMDKPLPANFTYRTLRERNNTSFEPKP